jgi:hypothetical protein
VVTDFHVYGFGGQRLDVRGRSIALTVDFEAFTPDTVSAWLPAMWKWAQLSAEGSWRSSLFVSVEDVVRLRASGGSLWNGFLRASNELGQTGATFYPHNHGIFDATTGAPYPHRPQRIPGYRKRASFFYDVVHRHGRDLSEWLANVVDTYDGYLQDANLHRPQRLAFRAGGWDHGDGVDAIRVYLDALADNAIAVDSSASSGVFGSPSWRVGAPFGSNVFALSDAVVELAPCWAFDCGSGVLTRNGIAAVRRLAAQWRAWLPRTRSGAFVAVVHFDHFFRAAGRAESLDGTHDVERRIERFFRSLGVLRTALKMNSAALGEVQLAG